MGEHEPTATSAPLSQWVAELAQPTGNPGGGAASGVMLSVAAALLRMVAEYTDDECASECAARLVTRRREALAAAEADGTVSAEFGAALALPGDDPARDQRVQDAALAAARSSVVIGDVGVVLLAELRLLAEIGSRHLAADLVVAAEALAAGVAGASVNLRANLQIAKKHGATALVSDELAADVVRLTHARTGASEIAATISSRFDD